MRPPVHLMASLAGLVVLSGIAVSVLLWTQESGRADDVIFWQDRIAQIGPGPAYEEFARSVLDLGAAEQHIRAHYFGEALYGEKGIDGIAVCDDRFAQGCLHDVLGLAIAEEGEEILPQASAACAREPMPHALFCQHAIGHGIVSWLGYGADDLKEALRACVIYTQKEDMISRCYSGVFMEYNIRLLLGTDGVLRSPQKEGWYSPCSAYSDLQQAICVFSLPRWWREALLSEGNNPVSTVRSMSGLCKDFPEGALKNSCDAGVGYAIAALADHDAKRIRMFCGEVGEGTPRMLCRAHAANVVLTEALKPFEAVRVCEGLEDDALRYCMTLAENPVPRTDSAPW